MKFWDTHSSYLANYYIYHLFKFFFVVAVKWNSRKLKRNLPSVTHSLFHVWEILQNEELFHTVSELPCTVIICLGTAKVGRVCYWEQVSFSNQVKSQFWTPFRKLLLVMLVSSITIDFLLLLIKTTMKKKTWNFAILTLLEVVV